MNPTPPNGKAARGAKPAVAIGKIGGNTANIDLKPKLTGDAAASFNAYLRAYKARWGAEPDKDQLAAHIIAAHIESDKGFQAWWKANREDAA